MIRIKRTNEPDTLKQSAVDETKNAKDLFDPARDNEGGIDEKRKKFKFEAYRKGNVKEELEKMSFFKCAYCESSFRHVYYGDIEHFRPKKKIGAGKDFVEPGYYWLAADWDNLYLSCLFCNQAKRQILPNGKTRTIGKQNQFPLSDENLYRRRRDHKNQADHTLDEQRRLLIDPCLDNPEEHLAYTENGEVLHKTDRGKHSIEVFALQRLYLVQERAKLLIEIMAQIERIREAIGNVDKFVNHPNPAIRTYYLEQVGREQYKLLLFTLPEKEYAGMARQFAYQFLVDEMKVEREKIPDLLKKLGERYGN